MQNRGNTWLLIAILILGASVLFDSFSLHIDEWVLPVIAFTLAYYFSKKGSPAKWLFIVLGVSFFVSLELVMLLFVVVISCLIWKLIRRIFCEKEIDIDEDLPPLSRHNQKEEMK